MKECLIQCLEEADLAYQIDDERVIISVESGSARYNVLACLAPELSMLIFYAICPITAATPRRPRLAELCTRINCGLPNGTFELNYETGEVRVRTTVDTGGGPMTLDLCRAALESNLAVMDHYLEGVMKVLYTNDSVTEILEELENEEDEEE